jgi:NAD(P)-dependent dehydrogenase (short-subunit alcohol dehydrogenase family)
MTEETLRGAAGAQTRWPLDRKVAIVTGASRGIGRAIALRLARDGAAVMLAARDQATLHAAVDEIVTAGGKAAALAVDLRGADSVGALVKTTVGTYGGIDIVVNNAGATKRGDFFELTEEDWADGFALKFFGAVRLARAAWPHLKRRSGAVLNIIGVGGRTPGAEFTIGGSVNGACLSFTKALADIGIRDGVQVNAINPGFVRTDLLRRWIDLAAAKHGGDARAAEEEMVRHANVARLGEPEDVAALAAYMVSPQARLLHGALIDLDGGQTKTV